MSECERSCLSCRRALDLNMLHSSIRRGSSARGRSIGLHGILKMRVTWTSKESTKRELLVPVDSGVHHTDGNMHRDSDWVPYD